MLSSYICKHKPTDQPSAPPSSTLASRTRRVPVSSRPDDDTLKVRFAHSTNAPLTDVRGLRATSIWLERNDWTFQWRGLWTLDPSTDAGRLPPRDAAPAAHKVLSSPTGRNCFRLTNAARRTNKVRRYDGGQQWAWHYVPR